MGENEYGESGHLSIFTLLKHLKLIFIDYKYGRIWYQCKGNDMRIIITLIPNKKKIWSAEIANQKLLRRPSRNLTRTRLWKTQICDVILWATLSKADDVLYSNVQVLSALIFSYMRVLLIVNMDVII